MKYRCLLAEPLASDSRNRRHERDLRDQDDDRSAVGQDDAVAGKGVENDPRRGGTLAGRR